VRALTQKSVIVLAVVLVAAPASAEWVMVSLEDQVAMSDLIVIATFSKEGEETRRSSLHEWGTLRVQRVIAGAATVGETLTLSWKNPVGLVCPRVDHSGMEGQDALWLLEASKKTRAVRADHPGRSISLEDRSTVERLVRHLDELAPGEMSPRSSLGRLRSYLIDRLSKTPG